MVGSFMLFAAFSEVAYFTPKTVDRITNDILARVREECLRTLDKITDDILAKVREERLRDHQALDELDAFVHRSVESYEPDILDLRDKLEPMVLEMSERVEQMKAKKNKTKIV